MLILFDQNKVKIRGLSFYKDLCITSTLSTGDKELSFKYPKADAKDIVNEGYIWTEDKTYFVIKSIDVGRTYVTVHAVLNVEELEGTKFREFDLQTATAQQVLDLALTGTGWVASVDKSITKKRTIQKTDCSSWDIIQDVVSTYLVEVEFDTMSKIVYVKNTIGSNKGVYFMEDLNLKELTTNKDTNEFFTQIKPVMKYGVTMKDSEGKDYVENYQYSNKKKMLVWKDERYTDWLTIKEDAIAKLDYLSKPRISYKADIIDLARLSDIYSALDFNVGDTIYLISKSNNVKTKQRIVKTKIYPQAPDKNTCEIANSIFSYEDRLKINNQIKKTVNNITETNGTISDTAIQHSYIITSKASITELNSAVARIGDLEATRATITELDVVRANIEDLDARTVKTESLDAIYGDIENLSSDYATLTNLVSEKANITDLETERARINTLESTKANITDLKAENITFGTATGGTLDVQTLLAQFTTGENAQYLNITTGNAVIGNAVIKDAMINSISASKLTTGTINTNNINIASNDNSMTISDGTIQFKDSTGNTRLQLGEDATGDFNFILKGADGSTVLLDSTGLKEGAIADDLIKSNMINDGAIGKEHINYSSLVEGLNEDGTAQLIKASKVEIDGTGQSLTVAFNSLETKVDGYDSRITSNTTSINAINGQIETLVSTTETLEGDVTTVKNNYSSLNQTVNGISSTVSSHTTQIASKLDATGVKDIINNTNFNNLVPNSNWENGSNGWRYSHTYNTTNYSYGITITAINEDKHYIRLGNTTSTTESYIYADSPKFPVSVGEKLTYSGIGYSLSNVTSKLYLLFSEDGTDASNFIDEYTSVVFTNSYTKQSNTVTVPTGAKYGFIRLRIDKKDTTINENSTAIFTSLMVARGEEVMKWTPNVQDSVLYTKTQVATLNSSITQLQNEIALKVSQTVLDDTLGAYAKTSALTQTADSIRAEFKSSGGYNLIRNSGGYGGVTNWTYTTTGTGVSMGVNLNNNIGSASSKYMYLDNGTNTTESFAFSSRFKLKKNTKYTFSGWFHNYTKCPSFDVFVLESNSLAETDTTNSYDTARNLFSNQSTTGGWKYFTKTFTTGASAVSGKIRIDNNGYNSSGSGQNRIHWSAIILSEGEEKAWTPHPSETYDGSTVIDSTGVTINNGALTVKNNNGETVLQGDSNGNLSLTGTVNIRSNNSEYLLVSTSNNNLPVLGSNSRGNFMSGLTVSWDYTAWYEDKALSGGYMKLTVDSSSSTISLYDISTGRTTLTPTAISVNNASTSIGNNIYFNRSDEQQIRFVNSSVSKWTAGFYKGNYNNSSTTVLGAYDWTNSLNIWSYLNDKTFYFNRPVTFNNSTLKVGSTAIMSTVTANSGVSIRYYDGTQICYGIKDFSASNLALTTQQANAVYSNDSAKGFSLTFAQAFASTPRVTSDCRGGGYQISQVASVINTSITGRIWSNYSATSSGVVFQYIAVGKWK